MTSLRKITSRIGAPIALFAALFISQAGLAQDLHELNFHGSETRRYCSEHTHTFLTNDRGEGLDHPVCILRHVVAAPVFDIIQTKGHDGPHSRSDFRVRSQATFQIHSHLAYSARAPPAVTPAVDLYY